MSVIFGIYKKSKANKRFESWGVESGSNKRDRKILNKKKDVVNPSDREKEKKMSL
jgi:hypothetical protein